jgi:predicted transcriptional regulator
MTVISLRLPDELEERLTREAQRANAARSEIARRAVAEYLERLERERLMAAFVAEARAAYADPEVRLEALEVAEEFAVADSEALDLAEGRLTKARRGRAAKKSLKRR